MSQDQLQAFQEAVKADAGLQEQLKAASDVDAVVAIANEAGFMISTENLKRAQPEISEAEEELAGVSGGLGVLGRRVLGVENYPYVSGAGSRKEREMREFIANRNL